MTKILISYILACYNAEKYIGFCLDILYAQDIDENEFEIICVNDCSKDKTLDIILDYKKEHTNLVLIDHESNKGLGCTRNDGLKCAQGKYLWFLDNDDRIKQNVIKSLIDECEKDSLDVLLFNFERINECGDKIENVVVFPDSEVMNGCEYIKQTFGEEYVYHLGYVWRQIYRNNYLKQLNVKFPEDSLWDDTVMPPKSLIYAKKAKSLEKSYYQYRINSNSISGEYNKKYRGDLIYQWSFVAGKELYDFSKEINEFDKEIASWLNKKSMFFFNGFTLKLIKAPFKEKMAFFYLLNENRAKVNQILPYLNLFNSVICRYYVIGILSSILIKPFYLFKLYIKKLDL